MSVKEAIIYCRTATTEQDINAQLELCKKYAIEHGCKVQEVFLDHGFSANSERPEFLNARKFMDGNPSGTLIVSSYDRLYRDSTKMNEFIQFAKEVKYEVVSANSNDGSLLELELIAGADKITKEHKALD